jgi:hypothetical protein
MQIDFANSCYTFAFQKSCRYDFEAFDPSMLQSCSFPCSEEDLVELIGYTSSLSVSYSRKLDQLVLGFSKLFSDQLCTVKVMVCQLDLTDDVPVRSRPYQCSPPRLQALREIVNDLLEKGVVKKSFSQYASPAFLVPKPQGGYRMVID